MKKLFFHLLFLISVFGNSQTIVPAGIVNGTWTLAGSPYIVTGDITSSGLIIQAGVDVRFQGSGLIVTGSFIAKGTSLLPIIFESDDTTGWSNLSVYTGGTKGIDVTGWPTDSCILDHCILRDCKVPANNSYGVGLRVNTSPCIISNSEFYHNSIFGNPSTINVVYTNPQILNNSIHDNYSLISGGLHLAGCGGLVSGNDIYNNSGTEGAGIYCALASPPNGVLITNNHIHDNRSQYDAGGLYIIDGPVTISNNVIAFNHSARAGSGIWAEDSNIKIILNWICNNTDSTYNNCGIHDGGGGITINNELSRDTSEIYNNIVANNNSEYNGGGMRILGGVSWVENNDVVNNSAHGLNATFSSGIAFRDSMHISLRNNICWGNRAYDAFGNVDTVQIIAGTHDTIAFENNVGESSFLGGILVNVGTILTGNSATNIGVYGMNPGLVAPTLGDGILFDATIADWNLVTSSVCVDAGTVNNLVTPPQPLDIYANGRIFGNTIDIGAAEISDQSGIFENENHSISIYPNPVSDILFLKNQDQNSLIRITDLLGNMIANEKYGQGINVQQLTTGIYFISFEDANGNLLTERFVKK